MHKKNTFNSSPSTQFVPFSSSLHLPSIIFFMSLAAGARGLASVVD
jgi:hypothetical protein